jgi:hypothetical protein
VCLRAAAGGWQGPTMARPGPTRAQAPGAGSAPTRPCKATPPTCFSAPSFVYSSSTLARSFCCLNSVPTTTASSSSLAPSVLTTARGGQRREEGGGGGGRPEVLAAAAGQLLGRVRASNCPLGVPRRLLRRAPAMRPPPVNRRTRHARPLGLRLLLHRRRERREAAEVELRVLPLERARPAQQEARTLARAWWAAGRGGPMSGGARGAVRRSARGTRRRSKARPPRDSPAAPAAPCPRTARSRARTPRPRQKCPSGCTADRHTCLPCGRGVRQALRSGTTSIPAPRHSRLRCRGPLQVRLNVHPARSGLGARPPRSYGCEDSIACNLGDGGRAGTRVQIAGAREMGEVEFFGARG